MNLATLFDGRYLTKGLALIASLGRHLPEWHLWVLAMDEFVWEYFRRHPVTNVTAVPLAEIEDTRVLAAQEARTWQEFCWTMGSAWTYTVMIRQDLESIAYIDADCYLFGDLAPLTAEVGAAPVAIVPHRWSPQHADRLRPNGTYNVSWVYFRRPLGLDCLKEWREQCLDWCYYRIEDGKMADQRYLENWDSRWDAHVVRHLGVGLAPWNQEQYEYEWDGQRLFVVDLHGDAIHRIDPVLLYHFHDHKGVRQRAGYPLHPRVAQFLYRPYEQMQDAIFPLTLKPKEAHRD